MTATNQMLDQKVSELETAVEEVQRELSRADRSRRSETHEHLAGKAREARAWLDRRRGAPQTKPETEDEAASLATEAESLLHDLRVHRSDL